MWTARLIGSLQRFAGRTPWLLRLAVRLRNQCQCVIGYAFAESNAIADDGEAALIAALAPQARLVVDVGANVGDWSGEVLRQAPGCRALLFDASRSAVRALAERFAGANVEIVHMGLADAPGSLEFFEEPQAGKTSSFTSGFSLPDAARTVVAVSTVAEQMKARGIDAIDMLKIDTEGYDMRVLRGAEPLFAAGKVGIVQFEYNQPWALAGGTLGEAVGFLTGRGYRVFALKSAGLFTFDYARYGEFFGYANFVAVSERLLPKLSGLVRGAI